MTGHPVAFICRALRIGRSTAYRGSSGRPRFYRRKDDDVVLNQIKAVTRQRASYGHRRVTVLVNRTSETKYNRKRIRRIMRMNGLQLPRKRRARNGRPHTGRVQTEQSNTRWSSDILEIPCWNGEVVHFGFAIDCHDREVLSYIARDRDLTGTEIRQLMTDAIYRRFPDGRPEKPTQWLSDNGGQYTALETVLHAEHLGLHPITTPRSSPESNGMSEAFVNTLKRDYVESAMLWTAERVILQIPGWIEDYNTQAPHSSLGMKSPTEYRAEMTLLASP